VIFRETTLSGAFIVDLEPRADERGFFARTFCEREFEEHGLPTWYPQCNLSRNRKAGTLRGMHYNAAPHGEAKLIRCATGAIYDVIIDLRAGSTTNLAWFGVELTAMEGRALFVPAGFVHGFITLEDDTDVFYQMGDFYRPEAARGLRWNDPRLAIRWPREPTLVAERDASYPDYDPATFDG
jgi:dTDP-4-dehydrorhamnose 3,5-epimerase